MIFIDRIRGDKKGAVWRGGKAAARRGESARGSDCGTYKGTDSGTQQTCQN